MNGFSMAVRDPLHHGSQQPNRDPLHHGSRDPLHRGSQQPNRAPPNTHLPPAFSQTCSSSNRDTGVILPTRRVKCDGLSRSTAVEDKMSNTTAFRRVVPDIKFETCESQRLSDEPSSVCVGERSSSIQTSVVPQRFHCSKNSVVVCDVHCRMQRPASTAPRLVTPEEHEDDVWVRCNRQLGPPLPPRAPILRRSVSLTHRPPPPPSRSSTVDALVNTSAISATRSIPAATSVMLPSRAMHQTFWTRSAPLLMDQIVPMSRWPLRERPSHVVLATTRSANVVPLMRWPLPESSARLAIDSMGKGPHGGRGNEYVEGPVGDRNGSGRKSAAATPSPLLRSSFPQLSPNVGMNTVGGGSPTVDEGVKRKRCSILNKLTQWCGRTKRESAGRLRTKEPRSVPCRCANCSVAVGERVDNDCEDAVNVLSCMCCIQPLFYHCLKDDGGGEVDCSDEPCAGCSRPHCALRWAIMALLLPCLPCLCFYVPLRHVLRSNCCRIRVLRCGCDSGGDAGDVNCPRGNASEGVLHEGAHLEDAPLEGARRECDPWYRTT